MSSRREQPETPTPSRELRSRVPTNMTLSEHHTADLDGAVRAFDLAAGREVGLFIPLDGAEVYALALSREF